MSLSLNVDSAIKIEQLLSSFNKDGLNWIKGSKRVRWLQVRESLNFLPRETHLGLSYLEPNNKVHIK